MRKICLHIFNRKTFYAVVKALFSYVILLLLYATLCLDGAVSTPSHMVPEILEYAAASASLILAGCVAFEYMIFED